MVDCETLDLQSVKKANLLIDAIIGIIIGMKSIYVDDFKFHPPNGEIVQCAACYELCWLYPLLPLPHSLVPMHATMIRIRAQFSDAVKNYLLRESKIFIIAL